MNIVGATGIDGQVNVNGTSKLFVGGDISGSGSLYADGIIYGADRMDLSGAMNVDGAMNIVGATTMTTITTSGLATVDSLSVTQDATVGGDLTVTGSDILLGSANNAKMSVANLANNALNTAGKDLTFAAGKANGTAVGGDIVFQVAPANAANTGNSGADPNALANVLTLANYKSATFSGTGAVGSNATVG